jgi:hypothetical protein
MFAVTFSSSLLIEAFYLQFPNAELFILSVLPNPDHSFWIYLILSTHIPILVAGTILTILSGIIGFVLFVYLILSLEVELK